MSSRAPRGVLPEAFARSPPRSDAAVLLEPCTRSDSVLLERSFSFGGPYEVRSWVELASADVGTCAVPFSRASTVGRMCGSGLLTREHGSVSCLNTYAMSALEEAAVSALAERD